MNSTAVQGDAAEMFRHAEEAGLRLAIIGRSVALVILGTWILGSRADDPARLFNYTIALAIFAILGLIHYSLIATRYDKAWVKYLFVSLDIAIVSALVATQPVYPTAGELSPVFIFRLPVFPFYFVVICIAALSFSPGLVAWSGIAGALGWMGAFIHRASHVDDLLNWEQIPPNPTARLFCFPKTPRKHFRGRILPQLERSS